MSDLKDSAGALLDYLRNAEEEIEGAIDEIDYINRLGTPVAAARLDSCLGELRAIVALLARKTSE